MTCQLLRPESRQETPFLAPRVDFDVKTEPCRTRKSLRVAIRPISYMGGQPSHPEEDASSEGSSDGATGRAVLVELAEQVRALSKHMQTMLQDMAVVNSRLARQEAATRATPWAPGPARAAAAMHGAPPHGVDVGASPDLNHSAFPFGAGEGAEPGAAC